MDTYTSGKEYSTEDLEEWKLLTVPPGIVVEALMDATGLVSEGDTWAGFFVHAVEILEDATVLLNVSYLGSSDSDANSSLDSFFVAGGYLHLCHEDACNTVVEALASTVHVVRLRTWSFED